MHINVTQRGGDVIFDIKLENINGLLDIRVHDMDASKDIWYLDFDCFNNSRLIYGIVPSYSSTPGGAIYTAKQIIPDTNEKPQKLTSGKQYMIFITAQYDTDFAATAERDRFSLMLDEKNGKPIITNVNGSFFDVTTDEETSGSGDVQKSN